MPRALIVYGTTHGQTAKIAHAMADDFRTEGWHVTVVEGGVGPELRPRDFDRVVVAASIHIGNYQRSVKRWVRRNLSALNGMQTAFVSVCMGVVERNPDARREVRAIPERFFAQSGWRPTATKDVAGAVPYTRYNWLTKLIIKRIAAKAGGATDTTRDFEYTDWADLRSFVHDLASHEGTFTPSSPSSDWGVARL